MDFIHLHNHSHYSLLDGLSTPEEIARIAKEHGQKAVSLTDHGTMGGALSFQEACNKYDIKAIQGCELYFTEDITQDKEDKRAERFHLIVLAKNDEGMQNLYRLQKESWTRGFYYKPRCDWGMLEKYHSGLIATSACMGGIIAKCIMNGEQNRAERIVYKMMNMFEDFYVELQPWNPPDLNKALIEIADAYEIPLIGTIDCHYPTKSHKELEEVLLCINQWPSMKAGQMDRVKEVWEESRLKKSVIEKLDFLFPDRKLRFWENNHWIMTGQEVAEQFALAGIERTDIFENTLEVADKCNIEIPMGQTLLPKYSKKINSGEYLKDIARFEMQEKGLTDQEYKDRLEEELDIITRLDFSDYFLIIWDVVNWAKANNIYVGSGRGSAAGSLVSYVLGITGIDPIAHNLIFWRFISPDRIDYPDIDLDFEDRRRDEIKQYLIEKWGRENVAAIATYGEFKPRASVKDVARIFGCPIGEASKVTQHFETSIEEFLGTSETQEFRSRWPDVTKLAQDIHGRIRLTGAGAAGMVVSSIPLQEIGPVESRNDPNSDDRIEVLAYDLDDSQKLGLIKLDILGLNTLSVVHDCVDVIQERYGIDISEASVTLDDAKVFKAFSEAKTVGIFQTESTAYKRLLLNMGIDNFNDLAASNALVRPGALLTQTDTYIKRKKGEVKTSYIHPILEEITKETYGTFVYQEQIMETVVNLAGMNWRDADILRKIMGKKKDTKEWEEYRQKFLDGATHHITSKQAEKMWEDFVLFSGYAFNKSHAVSYSKLSYQTMWLKMYYPTEFMWALLKNEADKEAISTYLLEAARMGIKVLTPDINKSGESFILEGDAIRFGLKNVAGIGPSAIKDILLKRPFESFDEFYEKRNKRSVKETAVEALKKIDAFGSVNYHAPYQYRKYYYEILNYPADMEVETPFDHMIISCDELSKNESQLGIIKAVVRSTKRKPNYFRVEFLDMSGTLTIFANQKWEIKDGQFFVAMVGDKTLHHTMDIYDADSDPLNTFLNTDVFEDCQDVYNYDVGDFDSIKTLCHIVSLKKIKTKAGALMAYMYAWDGKNYRKFVMFPKDFGKYVFNLEPWKNIIVRQKLIRKGQPNKGYTIDNLIEVDDFLSLKRK